MSFNPTLPRNTEHWYVWIDQMLYVYLPLKLVIAGEMLNLTESILALMWVVVDRISEEVGVCPLI